MILTEVLTKREKKKSAESRQLMLFRSQVMDVIFSAVKAEKGDLSVSLV